MPKRTIVFDDECVDCLIHELGLLLPECEAHELHFDQQIREFYAVRLAKLRKTFQQLTEQL